MLIVEASGDQDKFLDRIEAVNRVAGVVWPDKIELVVPSSYEQINFITRPNVHLTVTPHSYRRALDILYDGEGVSNVMVSAGNTKTLMLWTAKKNGLDAKRPPVAAAVLPKPKKRESFIFLDVGSTIWPTEEIIVWGALSGGVAARTLLNKPKVKIGLLNIGAEDDKGGPDLEHMRKKLDEILGNDFYGNIEFQDIFSSDVDVVVTSGLLGNLVLKSAEGTLELVKETVKECCHDNPLLYLAAGPLHILMKLFTRRISWRRASGAYVFGVDKPMLIAHGRSDCEAFENALKRAIHPNTQRIWQNVADDGKIKQWLGQM